MAREIKNICVYCASSNRIDGSYLLGAERLGKNLAQNGYGIIFGGGGAGSMGALADGALARGAKVTGIIPKFMVDLEWAHRGLSELSVVADMHERKKQMLDRADAAVALPGGSGTYEELLEALTWKRLGLFSGPIVIVNQKGFYRPLLDQLERSVAEQFMDTRHLAMWTVVPSVDAVVGAIKGAPAWTEDAVSFAVQR